MAAVAIRALEPREAAAWRELRLQALREDGAAFLGSYEDEAAKPVEDVAKRLGSTHAATAVFGAFDGDALVGSVGIGRWAPIKARHRAILWGMYVAPTHRRGGVGEALVRRAVAHLGALAEIGQGGVMVAAPPTAARRLYRRIGFAWCGRQPRAMKQADATVDEDLLVLRLGRPRGAAGPRPRAGDALPVRSRAP